MKIHTASWFIHLPDSTLRVGISRSTPRRMAPGFRILRALAPGSWFNSVTPLQYARLYRDEVLARLDRSRVIADLEQMAQGRDVALLCFEPANGRDWCHRSMAAAWLGEGLGRVVPEFGFDHLPQDQHPLLPPSSAGSRSV